MVTLFKITDQHGKCDDGLTWSPGETIQPPPSDPYKPIKFDAEWFDAELVVGYSNPLMAALFAPYHFKALDGWRLWGGEGNFKASVFTRIKYGPVKVIKECQFPLLLLRQRLRFAVTLALVTCETEAWRLWATSWLFGAELGPMHAKMAEEAAVASSVANGRFPREHSIT